MFTIESAAAKFRQILAPSTVLGVVVASWKPELFQGFSALLVPLLALTMGLLSLVIPEGELAAAARAPGRVMAAVAMQAIVLPALAWASGWVVGLDAETARGLLLVGCAPGALTSNLIAFLAQGATAFTVGCTVLSTLLSPVLMPGTFSLFGAGVVDVSTYEMAKTLVLALVLPLLVGRGIRGVVNRRLPAIILLAPGTASLIVAWICSCAVAANAERLAASGLRVFSAVILVNLLGYAVGAVGARWSGMDRAHVLAMSVSTGMRNAGMATALALAHLKPAAALPCATFAVWCVLTGSLAVPLGGWLRRGGHGHVS